MPSRAALLCALVALALPAWASANGGRYVLVGGTRAERQTVDSALAASSFDWNLVRRQITIEIVRGIDSQSVPGWIWLDADLLDAGAFSWGVGSASTPTSRLRPARRRDPDGAPSHSGR
jgi:hypothetical protein